MIKFDFENQTALVTGASRGIGKRIALDLLECGAELIVTGEDSGQESTLRDEFGRSTHFLAVDFSDSNSTRRFLDEIDQLDRIDVCINNAGILTTGPVAGIPEADWDETLAINLKAPFLVTQTVARIMKRHGYGRIVNIASIWGHITMPERAAYASSKSGLRGLTRSSAVDLASDNILVNAVSPGFTLTEIVRKNHPPDKLQRLADSVPLGRLAQTRDISMGVLFLASKLNTYIMGQSLVMDGGYSIV